MIGLVVGTVSELVVGDVLMFGCAVLMTLFAVVVVVEVVVKFGRLTFAFLLLKDARC